MGSTIEVRKSLGRPVLPKAGDPPAFEDEDRDLSHPLPYPLRQVVEVSLPFGDRGVPVEVQVQELAFDGALGLDDLGLPVRPDSLPPSVGPVITSGADEELAECPEMVMGDARSGGNLRQRWLIDGQEEGMYPEVAALGVSDPT